MNLDIKTVISGIIALGALAGAVAISATGGPDTHFTALLGLASSALTFIYGWTTVNPALDRDA